MGKTVGGQIPGEVVLCNGRGSRAENRSFKRGISPVSDCRQKLILDYAALGRMLERVSRNHRKGDTLMELIIQEIIQQISSSFEKELENCL